MISRKLIQMVQDHAEGLAGVLISRLKTDPHTPSYRCISEREILSQSCSLYKNLGKWMEGKSQAEIGRYYDAVGQARYREEIPLHELVYALSLTKNNLLDHIRSQGLAGAVLEIYAEQELQVRINHFFDNAIYYSVLGYGKAASAGGKSERLAEVKESTAAALSHLCP